MKKRETRGRVRSYNRKEILLDNKNVIIRAVVAVLALVIGVSFIVNGCSSYINKPTDLIIDNPKITNSNGDDVTLFHNEIYVNYYYVLDNEKSAKNEVVSKIKSVLEDKMPSYFMLLDGENAYLDNGSRIHNINYLNSHRNEFVSVDPFLFEALKESEKLREETNGSYSPFGGKLIDFWNLIFSNYNFNGGDEVAVSLVDPLLNDSLNDELKLISSAINSSDVSLEFKEDNHEVKFNCPSELNEYIDLDLFILSHAYYIDLVSAFLKDYNLTSGYIYSSSGMVSTLGLNYKDEQNLWCFNSPSLGSIVDNKSSLDYSFYFQGALNYLTFNPLLNNKYESYSDKCFYYLTNNDKTVIRSMLLDFSSVNTTITNYSTFTYSNKETLVSLLKDNYKCYFASYEDNNDFIVNNYNNDNNKGIIVSFNGKNKNVVDKENTALLIDELTAKYDKSNYLPFLGINQKIIKATIVAK